MIPKNYSVKSLPSGRKVASKGERVKKVGVENKGVNSSNGVRWMMGEV